jgi:ABC-type glycerol-3-phosphate transport system permease component
MVSGSFKTVEELYSSNITFFAKNFTLENYKFLFNATPFARQLFNSLITTISYTFLSVFFCSLAGFAFAKLSFPGRRVLYFLLIATLMIPMEVAIVPSFVIMSALHWVNTYWAIIIPGSANALGIFFMRQYIISIPDELIDAARIDGCSDFVIYFRIILPVIKPALAALAIITFVPKWNDFIWPLLVLRSEDMLTATVGLNLLPAQQFSTPWGVVLAGCTMITMPPIIIFLLFQRYFISGVTLGAVK